MVTFCLDFGNTRLKAAVFVAGQLKEIVVLKDDGVRDLRQMIEQHKPTRSLLSSVVEHAPDIEKILQNSTQFHKLTNNSRLPFTIPVGKPETVGADRLAVAAAAVHFYPAQNNLAIVLGSCVTYNFINGNNELIGGAISPGMEMRFKAMHHYTALLPLVEADWNVPLIGYDTKTNLQSGVILGMAREIDGIIDLYAARYSKFNVLLTGGDMTYFAPHLKNKIFADTDLIFKGLYAISQNNFD